MLATSTSALAHLLDLSYRTWCDFLVSALQKTEWVCVACLFLWQIVGSGKCCPIAVENAICLASLLQVAHWQFAPHSVSVSTDVAKLALDSLGIKGYVLFLALESHWCCSWCMKAMELILIAQHTTNAWTFAVQVLTAGENEELCYCLKAWQALPRSVQYGASPDTLAALQATAVVDRIRRALGDISNVTSERVQPVATAIGQGCGVQSWVVEIFSEEVVRAGPAFAVSLVLSTVEPALRKCAQLGSWQIISPANVTGAFRWCTFAVVWHEDSDDRLSPCLKGGRPLVAVRRFKAQQS